MLHLTVLAVGRLREPHLRALCDDFKDRLSRYAKVRVVEVKDAHQAEPDDARTREAATLRRKLPRNTPLVALHRGGCALSSRDLSDWLQTEAQAGRSRLSFAIGGPWGLAAELIQEADLQLSLSRLTLTHELARLLLLEQLYRAMTIWRGEPYHRGP